ncbi:MAG: MFS transporter [Chloroflexi bacterium]|nr:MFS transporter [Chloroflexota bacterium]
MKSINTDKYRQILQHKSFRNFWLGFTFSGIGDAMARVALTWYVWEKTHSAAALGLLTFMYLAPVIVGGLAAGWLLDRYDRRKVIMIDNLVRGVVMSILPIVNWAGVLELWHVYAIAGVYGALMMISVAGGPALVPSLVPEEQLATANALETVSWTLSGVVGPPIAGLLLAQFGAMNVVIIDALTYFLFAYLLTKVVVPVEEEQEAQVGVGQGQKSYGLGDAVRLMMQEKVLLATTLMFMSLVPGIRFNRYIND